MSRFDDIAANSRRVVDSGSASSATEFEYRRLTSNRGVEPRTWTAWRPFTGLPTAGRSTETWDELRKVFKNVETLTLRSPDNLPSPVLTQGDQVRDSAGITWAVMGTGSSGPGTVAYSMQRETPLRGDEARQGGT
jgi:hypothetical protein